MQQCTSIAQRVLKAIAQPRYSLPGTLQKRSLLRRPSTPLRCGGLSLSILLSKDTTLETVVQTKASEQPSLSIPKPKWRWFSRDWTLLLPKTFCIIIIFLCVCFKYLALVQFFVRCPILWRNSLISLDCLIRWIKNKGFCLHRRKNYSCIRTPFILNTLLFIEKGKGKLYRRIIVRL